MARKPHKYHYIYKITCLKNGRYYIGMHSTNNLEDGYFGGGKRIKNSVKRHGKDAHRKEILEFFESRELLADREAVLVNEELLKDPMCMNLCKGGHYYDRGWTEGDRIKASNRLSELFKNPEWSKGFRERILGDNNINKNGDSFRGKHHSDKAKKTMGEINKIKQKGNKNSQFGKKWIYNDITRANKKITINDIDLYIGNGWKFGMKMEYFKMI